MDYISEKRLQDCSTPELFQFSISCSECKEIWKSRPIRFTRAGVKPKTEGKKIIFKTLYDREKAVARNLAMKEAETIFSPCPICHRVVCDHCFLICDELDMCCACAKELQEKGEPVMEKLMADKEFIRERSI